MADRVKLWLRLCAACGVLDRTVAAIATEDEGERSLGGAWSCPACGGTDGIATRPLEDGDFDVLDDGRPGVPRLLQFGVKRGEAGP